MKRTREGGAAALTGAAFAVLYIAGWVLSTIGVPDGWPPTADELVTYYEEHAGSAMIGSMLTGLSVVLLLWFLGSLRLALRRAEGGDGRLADIATGGGVVAAAVLLVASSAQFMPAVRADEESTIDPAVATAMSDLHAHLAGAIAPLAFGVLVVATAVIGLRSGLLPRWLSWVSVLLGLALILPAAPWVAIMFFPFWVLGLSLMLYRRERAEAAGGVVIGGTHQPAEVAVPTHH